jgi:hypothetical protein
MTAVNKTIQDLYIYCTLIRPNKDSHVTDTHKFIQETISQHIWGYQLLTKPSDKNGNTFCTIVCYSNRGDILLVFACNNSRPNCIKFVTNRPCGTYTENVPQLPTFNLTASDYNAVINNAKNEDKLYYMC